MMKKGAPRGCRPSKPTPRTLYIQQKDAKRLFFLSSVADRESTLPDGPSSARAHDIAPACLDPVYYPARALPRLGEAIGLDLGDVVRFGALPDAASRAIDARVERVRVSAEPARAMVATRYWRAWVPVEAAMGGAR